jgi:hypothetical protein
MRTTDNLPHLWFFYLPGYINILLQSKGFPTSSRGGTTPGLRLRASSVGTRYDHVPSFIGGVPPFFYELIASIDSSSRRHSLTTCLDLGSLTRTRGWKCSSSDPRDHHQPGVFVSTGTTSLSLQARFSGDNNFWLGNGEFEERASCIWRPSRFEECRLDPTIQVWTPRIAL